MIAVHVRQVEKHFGTTVALNRVSLDIEPGELFFLLGPSGCGKTTLLRCLAGFYTPEQGSIHFGEHDVTRLEPHKRNTGMMFQSYALWPHMTVTENVAFGLQQRKVPKADSTRRVEEALETVHMTAYADRKPNQLSGGQQQRVALARALVIRPQCLLLDEPLSNLDAKLRNEMRMEIRRICKEFDLTTIYVTHDQKEALSIADRMAVLKDGEILQVGSPREVYKRPCSRFVASFIGEANFLQGTLKRSGAGEGLVDTPLGEIRGALAADETPPGEGDSVTLVIRPESLKLDLMAPDENAFEGSIGEAVYYGEVAHYRFAPKENPDFQLAISELNPKHRAGADRRALYAWADPEDVVILKGDPA
ncbi:MAG: ABC transporter ATP-binding protein [Opitutales bacterium]